jgi:hypothetical protein
MEAPVSNLLLLCEVAVPTAVILIVWHVSRRATRRPVGVRVVGVRHHWR